jgi:aspartate carbamoyltransferase catalytic subunit
MTGFAGHLFYRERYKGCEHMPLSQKDLLGLRGMPKDEILEILNTAVQMKKFVVENQKRTPHLQGKSIVTLFYENSTRTRMSFELASKYMGAASANIAASASSVSKGETLIDTGCSLDMMGTDLIIMRHPMSGAPHLLAKHVRGGVINAGDGMNEHPTQGLLDLFTMRERLGRLEGLKVAIVGDIAHSRVARSNIWGLHTMGSQVVLAAPQTLLPEGIGEMGVKATTDADDAVRDADVVMALRIQLERQQAGLFPSVREYHKFWGINDERLRLAKPGALVMHPGPVNRGVELASALADGSNSAIREQVLNGVAVRMAILFLMTRRAEA